MNYPHLASRVFDTPLLVMEQRAKVLGSYLAHRMGHMPFQGQLPIKAEQDDEELERIRRPRTNVAVLPITGTLINRGTAMDAMSGMQSFQTLNEDFDSLMADDEVDAILLEIDSPGGEVAGTFSFAEKVFNARSQKPIVAFVNELSASAAFAIASAAEKIVVPSTGFLGSVGVVMTHMDVSQALEKDGVVVTHIFAGKHKVDGSSFQPLTKEVTARLQSDINSLYSMFVETVARNRGMTTEAVRATEAQVFLGEQNVDIGFADEIGTIDDALSLLIESTGSRSTIGGLVKTDTTTTASTEAPEVTASAQVEQIDLDAVTNEAFAEGQTAERERIKTIMSSEEAQGKQELAQKLAYEKSMSAEDAIDILASAADETITAEVTDQLGIAMSKEDKPEIGVDAASDSEKSDDDTAIDACVGAFLATSHLATNLSEGV